MTTAKTAAKTTAKTVRKPSVPAKTVKARPAKSAAPAASPVVQVEAGHAKPKLVRDSFTIPKSEYALLDLLKARATRLKRPTKKSEMLRAGIAALQGMGDKAFLGMLNSIPSLKTGRPLGTEASSRGAKKSTKSPSVR